MRYCEAAFAFLLPLLTPRTVFAEIGARDCALALRIAEYVDRVWCVDCAVRVKHAPCNLRYGLPSQAVDIAFSETPCNPAEVRRLLKPGGVWFVYGHAAPERTLTDSGYPKIAYYGGGMRLPRALARLARTPVTAAYA
jgi:hypothetical protein